MKHFIAMRLLDISDCLEWLSGKLMILSAKLTKNGEALKMLLDEGKN